MINGTPRSHAMLPAMRVFVLAAVTVLVGCKDKITSISESSEVNHLAIDDAVQYCKDVREYRRTSIPAADSKAVWCGVRVLSGAAIEKKRDKDKELSKREACRKALDECLEKDQKSEEMNEMDCSRDKVRDTLRDCPDLTVGEMNDCLRELPGIWTSVAKQDPCKYIDDDADGAPLGRYIDKMTGPKCEAFQKKCGIGKIRKKSSSDDPLAGDDSALGSLQTRAMASQKLDALEDLKIRMCACRERACIDEAKEALAAARTDYATTYTEDQQKRRAELDLAVTKCESKFLESPPK